MLGIREGFKKKYKKIMENSIIGGRGGQQGLFSIFNFFYFFLAPPPDMVVSKK